MLSLVKCVITQPTFKFLGHQVSTDSITPDADNVKAIWDFPQPATVRQLVEFNGMVNFHHRFVQNAAKIISPLYNATARIGPGKSALAKAVDWTPVHIAAIRKTKETQAQATV